MAKAPAKAPQEESDVEDAAAAKPAKKKLFLLIGIGLVVVAISVGGTIAAISMFGGDKKEAVAEGEVKEGEHSEEAKPEKAELTYLPLEPAFLTNFTVNGRPRYLQLSLTAVSRDKAVLDAVQKHSPLIRNRIVMLLSAEQFETLRTRAGREALQTRLQNAVREILQKEGTKGELDKILFTNFVMQ